jgi:hypothetical protein
LTKKSVMYFAVQWGTGNVGSWLLTSFSALQKWLLQQRTSCAVGFAGSAAFDPYATFVPPQLSLSPIGSSQLVCGVQRCLRVLVGVALPMEN